MAKYFIEYTRPTGQQVHQEFDEIPNHAHYDDKGNAFIQSHTIEGVKEVQIKLIKTVKGKK